MLVIANLPNIPPSVKPSKKSLCPDIGQREQIFAAV